MATKLTKNQFPSGHSESDFQATGPVVVKDTEWGKGQICDLGCFKQTEGVDSNKYYHIAIVQSKLNNKYYTYFEWGKTKPNGRPNRPAYQFNECFSLDEAIAVCAKQFKSKNTSRGQWDNVAGRKIFVPRSKAGGKTADLYIVRPLAKRLVGLPCVEDIAPDNAQGENKPVVVKKTNNKKTKSRYDKQTVSLFRDLIGGTQRYAHKFVGSANGAATLPTQQALDDGRDILSAATSRLSVVGENVDKQIKDKQLNTLTQALYGLIPKKISKASSEDYILSSNNIAKWELDIDVLESALQSGSVAEETGSVDDSVMAGIPADIRWVNPEEELYQWLIGPKQGDRHTGFWPSATRYRSGTGRNPMKVSNLWEVQRIGDRENLRARQKEISVDMRKKWNNERPMFVKKKRPDLSTIENALFWKTNTGLLWHGTRSVNTVGIVRENLRFPKELSNASLSYLMFGPGQYFASDWSKSAGYCSDPRSVYGGNGGVSGRKSFMFGFDVCLGIPHMATQPRGYAGSPSGTHSVFAKSGQCGRLRNDEHIIYERNRIEMRYLAEIEW